MRGIQGGGGSDLWGTFVRKIQGGGGRGCPSNGAFCEWVLSRSG